MAKTGIHIKRANVGSVEAHNLRTEQYLEGLKKAGRSIYFFQDQTHLNQSWVNPLYQGKTCEEIQKDLIDLYKSKVGQSPQLKDRIRTNKKTGKEYTVAGWSPIREGVVPIKDSTTLDDFKLVKDWAKSKGLDVIRIDIHHDEGYRNEDTGETKHNRHAHIIFDWVDHGTGKTLKLDEKDMSEFQDIVAQSLQMERGVAKAISGAEHIDHAEYRQIKAEQVTKELEEKSYQAQQKLKEADAMKELIEKVEIPKMRKEADEKIEKEKQKADEEIAKKKEDAEAALKKAIADLEKEKADAEQSLKDVNEKITAKGEEIEAKNKELEKALDDLKEARDNKTTTEGDITELEQNKAEIEGDITKAKDKLKELDDNKDSLLVEIENLKGKEKELMKEGWSAFGWVAKRFIGIKDEKQQQAMEELYNLKNEIMSETERNLVSADKLIRAKSNNLPSKDKTILEIVRDFVPIEPAIRRVVEIAESALEWGITNVEHIKYLISGGNLTLRSGSQIQGVEIDDDVRVAAVRTKEDRYSVRAIFDNLQLTIKEFVSKIKQKQEEKKRAMVEAKAKRIIESAAPQKPAPRFTAKYTETERTPKKINVPKKSEGKKMGRRL